MPKSVLIIGEDPALIDFAAPGAPPNMDADKVMRGLNGSRDRLEHAGHDARILLTRDAETVEAQLRRRLIGAGLRTLPGLAKQFERLINVLHEQAPQAKLAFNSQPDDSDKAALRWLLTP